MSEEASGGLRHFLDVGDLDGGELAQVLELARRPPGNRRPLAGRGVALLFEKPSNRTRVSMEMAVVALGGHPVSIRGDEVGIDSREPAEDVARSLSAYVAVIAARVFEHRRLERLAASAGVPVVNLLSDSAHPCQVLADLLTLRAHFGELGGRTLAWIGDGNNVCRSLMAGAALAGMVMRVATPPGFEPPPSPAAELTSDPFEAVKGADAVYTDVWASMGQEDQAAERRAAFAGFTVDDDLMAAAGPDAVFLHCLPAHRGEEVSASVVDGPRSLVWEQSANRLPAQRALLEWILGARP